jgi:hypothetical protein
MDSLFWTVGTRIITSIEIARWMVIFRYLHFIFNSVCFKCFNRVAIWLELWSSHSSLDLCSSMQIRGSAVIIWEAGSEMMAWCEKVWPLSCWHWFHMLKRSRWTLHWSHHDWSFCIIVAHSFCARTSRYSNIFRVRPLSTLSFYLQIN